MDKSDLDTFFDVRLAQMHSPVFCGGKNMGEKLNPAQTSGLGLRYSRKLKELEVTWNGEVGYAPHTNVKFYIPGKAREMLAPHISHPMVAGISSAQVETPMSHVHAGVGKGKTGK